MALTVGYAQSLQYPAALDRRIVNAGYAHTTGVGLRSGVIPANGDPFKVTATTGLNVATAAGHATVDPYTVANDSTATVAAQVVTTARWDLVILRIYDTEAGHVGPSRAVIEIIKGTTTADPAVPVPAYSLLLARIRLPASQSTITNANIDDLRVFTAAAGGAVTIPGALAAALTGNHPALPEGTPIWDSTGGCMSVMRGGQLSPITPRVLYSNYAVEGDAAALNPTIVSTGSQTLIGGNRRIRAEFTAIAQGTEASNARFQIVGLPSPQSSSALLAAALASGGPGGQTTAVRSWDFTAAGSVSLSINLRRYAGGGTVSAVQGTFVVTDLGPVT